MNKLLTIFFLYLVTAKASAQLNTFESGQTIRADEMNENFEYLQDEIDQLSSANSCNEELVYGTYSMASVYQGEREVVTLTFSQGGNATLDINGPEPADDVPGTFSVGNDCIVRIDIANGGVLIEGFVALNGMDMSLVGYSPEDDQYDAFNLVKTRR